MSVLDIIRRGSPQDCRPWPRFLLTRPQWGALAEDLATDQDLDLMALWAEPGMVHAALLGAFALALLGTVFWGWRRIFGPDSLPDRIAASRRIERSSGLPHAHRTRGTPCSSTKTAVPAWSTAW